LHDRETKQVQFVAATGVKAPVVYVYDGVGGFGLRLYGGLNNDRGYGGNQQKKSRSCASLLNAETNQLGIALPAGKLRFIATTTTARWKFHRRGHDRPPPRNEPSASRPAIPRPRGETQADKCRVDSGDKWMDETFEIQAS